MTAPFREPVTLTVTMRDLATVLTEQVCTFNALAGLEVVTVHETKRGEFELHLLPKTRTRPAPPKAGQQ